MPEYLLCIVPSDFTGHKFDCFKGLEFANLTTLPVCAHRCPSTEGAAIAIDSAVGAHGLLLFHTRILMVIVRGRAALRF